MAKLVTSKTITTANTGTQFLAKMKRLSEIKINPELAAVYDKEEKILNAIAKSIESSGYDEAEPVVVWKETGEIVDGHSRYEGAIRAHLYEIPVVEKSFNSLEEAKAYTEHRQLDRRNLTQAEIYERAVALEDVSIKTGEGRSSEKLAGKLGISASTIQHARTVEKKASPDVKEKLKNNEMTINQAYQTVRSSNKKTMAKATPVKTEASENAEEGALDDFSVDISVESSSLSTDFRNGFLNGFERGLIYMLKEIENGKKKETVLRNFEKANKKTFIIPFLREDN